MHRPCGFVNVDIQSAPTEELIYVITGNVPYQEVFLSRVVTCFSLLLFIVVMANLLRCFDFKETTQTYCIASMLCEARGGVFPPTTMPCWCTFGRCSPGAVLGWNGGGEASCGIADAAHEAKWAVEALAAAGTLSALLVSSDASAVLLDIVGILLH